MLRLVIVFALIDRILGNERIIGGENSNIENFNYQMSLLVGGERLCGGALVQADVVVTTAMCFSGLFPIRPKNILVRAGSSTIHTGIKRLVKHAETHPLFVDFNYDYNVVVLTLEKPFELTSKIGTIELINKNYKIVPGTLSAVTGWGATAEGYYSEQLQYIQLPYMDWNFCKREYRKSLTDRTACWGEIGSGKAACWGDFGGPAAINDESGKPLLAALSDNTYVCGTDYPGFYTNIANPEINDFITKYLSNN